jgi:hypothetical protein
VSDAREQNAVCRIRGLHSLYKLDLLDGELGLEKLCARNA